MATLQNIGKLKYRGKDGQWHPLPVVVQDAGSGVSTISGKGAPTSETQGEVNQLYRDEDTQKLYICTATDGGYTWAAVVSDTEDAVTYTAQTLTEEQKTQARANIGAGTSNFSGLYNDLPDKPNIPAATVIDTTLTKSGQAADAKAAGDAIEKKLDATALPTAVNDALAQAKASGEFDGAGMDVTGAKVGQIAKITAVDSTGKPTAWEPVDMPSDVAVVNITSTTDNNGNTTYLSDMTAVEICEQWNQGKVCVAKCPFAFNGINIPAIFNLDVAMPYENNSGAYVSFDGLVLNYIVLIDIVTSISDGLLATEITMSNRPASSGPTYVYLRKSDNDPTILNIAPEAGLSIVDLHDLVRQRMDVKLVFEGGVYSLVNDPSSGDNTFARIRFKTVNGIEKAMYSSIYVYTGIGGEGASISLSEDEL